MRGKMIAATIGLCALALTACATPQIESARPAAEREAPTAPPTLSPTTPPTEEQIPATEAPPVAPTQPVSTPHLTLEPVGTTSETGARVTGEAPQALLDAILADAAARTGLDPSELVIVQDEAVVWPDGSLGCPEPGMMYTMALVDGYHVIVQAGEQELDYRAGRNNFFKLCEHPSLLGRGDTPTR